MSRQIPRNSICPLCNSGLKYKNCCGRNKPLKGETLEFISGEKVNPSPFEKEVFSKFGHYPDDYISPIKEIRDEIYILTDESNIGEYYAVSGIVINKTEIDNNIDIKSKLKCLVEEYNIDYIHFTEIFGSKRILGENRKEFLKKFISLTKGLEIIPFSVCKSKSYLKEFHNQENLTSTQIYISLFWQMMFEIVKYLTYKYGTSLVIKIWRETENITAEKRILHQVNIRGLIEKFPFAKISIYKHYSVFYKEEILYSSLSDFLAYFTTGICPKMGNNYNIKKIVNNYYELLFIFSELFGDHDGVKIKNLDQLLELVKNREKYQRKSIKY